MNTSISLNDVPIPRRLMEYIISFFTIESISNLSLSSKEMKKICDSELIWESIFFREKFSKRGFAKGKSVSYKELVKRGKFEFDFHPNTNKSIFEHIEISKKRYKFKNLTEGIFPLKSKYDLVEGAIHKSFFFFFFFFFFF